MSAIGKGRLGSPTAANDPSKIDWDGARAKLVIDAKWRVLIEEVCILKEAIDLARLDQVIASGLPWVVEALRSAGLAVEDFKHSEAFRGIGMPDGFLQKVMGSWFSHREQDTETFRGAAEIPEWSVVGWLRLEPYRHTSSLSAERIAQKAQEVLAAANAREKVSTYGFEGLPLLWAGEGKNRTQLFRLAGVARRSELILYHPPDLSKFVARPLLGKPGLTVLSMNGVSEVLPFGNLSRRLLMAMGVRWSDSPALLGWMNLKCGRDGEKVSLGALLKMRGDETRIRLALIGGCGEGTDSR